MMRRQKQHQGLGFAYSRPHMTKSLRFVNEMHGQEDLRKCSQEFMKEKRN